MLNIVIPMAGRGSRFASAGYELPKPLIDVNGKPMIEVVVRNLRSKKQQYRFIFICQNEHIEKYDLRNYLETVAPGSVTIGIDGVTKGAACTVLLAKDYINSNEPLMIANSDQWVDIAIDDYLTCISDRGLDGLIMTMGADDTKWSYAAIDTEGLVTDVQEKKVISNEATVGIYNFTRGSDFCRCAEKMIANNELSNGEFYVAPVYNYLIKEQGKIGIYNIGKEADGMYGLGIPSDLELFLNLPISERV
ncbi:bifunctional N-acetylglucosamine-1-phosphate uridyltransferase/glucosamine-1-phosphate acetyltransferase [Serratia fonticola]|uniref:glycosyltransferase family 2 protein n=1 Tax=Serratia fonticola TaxID=47917 RepID=UPI00217ACC61|nr:glycosyltransferase family 2 protein [Serratia fonticola]CAI1853248.1 bifunctional N-acetylglucosamine-1-phosphate uridyltransferase/glucosamine-1-phosphate acetyltransferase [Serratia fonticola]